MLHHAAKLIADIVSMGGFAQHGLLAGHAAVKARFAWRAALLMAKLGDDQAYSSLKFMRTRVIVDSTMPVAYLVMPKAGSTTIISHMLARRGRADITQFTETRRTALALAGSRLGLRPADLSAKRDAVRFFFTVVRHPIARLQSAYRNQIAGQTASARVVARRIDASLLDRAGRIPFEAFVDHVVGTDPLLHDVHWRPQTVLLRSAMPDLDFIGRLEHLNDDLARGFAGTEWQSWLDGFPSVRGNVTDKTITTTLDPVRLARLRDYYKDDLVRFGYADDAPTVQ